HHAQVKSELAELAKRVHAQRLVAEPLLESLRPGNRPPSIQDKFEIAALTAELEAFMVRTDIALQFISTPFDVALIGMNNATHAVFGNVSRFKFDLEELAREALAEGLSDAVPGIGLVLAALDQFRDRIQEAQGEIIEGAQAMDRIYNFKALAVPAL